MTTRYVNTASTAGGDGTTNATTGANRAYASLAEWEAAEQAILSEDHTVLCCGATDDTETTIDGWTPSGFRVIVAGNTGDAAGAHAGKWDTAFYTIGSTSGTSAAIVPIEESVTIQDIQFTNSNSSGGGVGRFGTIGNDLIIQRCVLKGPGTGGSSTGLLLSDVSNLRTIARNNISHDWNVGGYLRGTSTPGANACVFANNTFTQNATGFQGRGGGPRAVNNLTFGNTADMGRTAADWDEAASYYNAFGNSGTLVPGSTDIDLSAYAATDLFLDNANEDFHLLSSGSAYSSVDNNGVGPDSNTDVPDDDIDGDARTGTTTSVGADIIVAGGTIYTRTLSDSASITDAPIRGVKSFRQMPQDALAIAELIARGQMHGRTTADSVSISEDVRRAALLFRKENDSAAASDSTLRFVKMFRRLLDDAVVTDGLAVTITLGSTVIITRILQDGLDVQDTVMRAVRMYRLESQVVDVVDNSWYSASIVRGLIDTLSVAETAARAMLRGRVVSDSVEAVDLAVRYALLYRVLHDDADAYDSLVQTITYYETLVGFVLMSLRSEPAILSIDKAQPIIMEMRNV
ncbi:MAG: autotransporter outer membrane beta-barrel domain-containing protein [Burkholderiales bacterium]